MLPWQSECARPQFKLASLVWFSACPGRVPHAGGGREEGGSCQKNYRAPYLYPRTYLMPWVFLLCNDSDVFVRLLSTSKSTRQIDRHILDLSHVPHVFMIVICACFLVTLLFASDPCTSTSQPILSVFTNATKKDEASFTPYLLTYDGSPSSIEP